MHDAGTRVGGERQVAMVRQYILGANPLSPRRMTQAEIADLVARAQAATQRAKSRGGHAVKAKRATAPATPIRVAVRYMALCNVGAERAVADLADTCRPLLNADAVRRQWYRTYPGRSKPGARKWR